MNVETVFFDLGNTLVHNRELHHETIRRACRALADECLNLGYTVDPAELARRHFERLTAYYEFREIDFIELSADVILRRTLQKLGVTDLLEQDLIRMLRRFYEVTQQNWFLTPGVPDTLCILKEGGLRIGLISNASYEADVMRLLNKYDLARFLNPIVISAHVGFRKPRAEIFAYALEKAGSSKEAAVMIGDSLLSDIHGAGKFGMRTIWFKRYYPENKNDGMAFKPDQIAMSMEEIPAILNDWKR